MISASLYISIYRFLLWLFVAAVLFASNWRSVAKSKPLAALLLLLVLSHIAFRPISPEFGDTGYYAKMFEFVKYQGVFDFSRDKGFVSLTSFLSFLPDVSSYFLVLGCIYVLPVYYGFKKEYPEGFYLALLLHVITFSFWGYAVNGVRNGLAASLVIAGLFANKNLYKALLFIAAASLHKSMLLPVLVAVLAYKVKNVKFFYAAWILCLLLTLATSGSAGSYIAETVFSGEEDSRFVDYMSNSVEGTGVSFSRTGFRWDFVLYSAVPILMGYYYIFKRQICNELYRILYCTYIGANAFWLLCIYTPYSNRFAYLSWFIYSIVLSYPLLKYGDVMPKQDKAIKLMIFASLAFSTIMA